MSENLLSELRARVDRELTDIESRDDLTDDKKVNQVIVIFSTTCAAIAVQPVPFADFFILTPLQAYMGARISAIRGTPLNEKEVNDLIVELMGVVGLGMVAQQIGIAAAKAFFPIFGSVATVPVVFSLTYAIGKLMDAYFVAKVEGQDLSAAQIKDVWKRAKKDGRREAKNHVTKAKSVDGS